MRRGLGVVRGMTLRGESDADGRRKLRRGSVGILSTESEKDGGGNARGTGRIWREVKVESPANNAVITKVLLD